MRNYQPTFRMAFAAAALVALAGPVAQAAETDARIEASAQNSYNFKTYLKDDQIKVSSSGGTVTLTGTVAREYHKSLAQETVSGLPGVKGVNNQLMVVGDQPAANSDAWITLKVKTALTFRKNVSAGSTEVNTSNGVVTLTGKADSSAQKELTGEYAKDVEGVTEVRNELVVANPAPAAHRNFADKVDDVSITAQVKTTLLFHKSTHVLATKIVTKDGIVTLHGEAKNAAERDLAAKYAEDIKGVKQVNNRMTVRKS